MASLQSQARRKGRLAMSRLEEMKEKYEILGDVRGIGMMIGIEFVKDKKTKQPAEKERDAIISYSFNNGLVMLPCGESSIRIIPPITISEKHLSEGLDILEASIRSVNASSKKA
jgi:4-aminobutyrate aminotransferase